MKFEEWQGADLKRSWKIVRTDDYTDIAGEIISADTDTGEYCVRTTVDGAPSTKKGSLGQHGIRIVGRRR
jgi:hypothetical protein